MTMKACSFCQRANIFLQIYWHPTKLCSNNQLHTALHPIQCIRNGYNVSCLQRKLLSSSGLGKFWPPSTAVCGGSRQCGARGHRSTTGGITAGQVTGSKVRLDANPLSRLAVKPVTHNQTSVNIKGSVKLKVGGDQSKPHCVQEYKSTNVKNRNFTTCINSSLTGIRQCQALRQTQILKYKIPSYSLNNITALSSCTVQIPCEFYSTQPKIREKKEEYREETEDKAQDVETQKKHTILTVPNILTTCRLVVSPYLGYLVIQEDYHLACGVFIFAGVTDLLDGYIARNYPNQTSALGSFLDPLADKFLISILFLSLTIVELIPVPLTALIIFRDVCLIAAAFYVRFISLTPPITFYKTFDITNASAQLQPTTLSKVNTAVQLGLVALTLGAPVFSYVDHPAMHALWYLTAATTLVSGLQYIVARDTFKILKKPRRSKD